MILDDFRTLPSSAKITDEGFLELTGNLARVGVMTYSGKELGKDPSKIYRLYRSADVVRATAERLKNKPVTVNHPQGGVSIQNSDREFAGTITDTWYDDATGWAKGKILLTHKKAIKAFFDGYDQLSVGANQVELEDYAGQWIDELGTVEKGKVENYDLVVKDLNGNHVALVNKARAGDKATFDSQNESIIIDSEHSKKTTMEKKFTISLFDGSTVDLSGDNARDIYKTFESLTKDNQELTTKLKTLSDAGDRQSELETQIATLTKQLDAAKGELEATKVKLNDAAMVNADADSRKAWLQTYSEVKPMLNDSGDDVFGMSVADLKRAAVKAQKGLDLSDKSDDYVDAFYAGLQFAPKQESPAKQLLDSTKQESNGDSLAAAFAAHNERIAKNAYAIFGGN